MGILGFSLASLLKGQQPIGQDLDDSQIAKSISEDTRPPILGVSGASVTIVAFLDYLCPACRASHDDLMALVKKNRRIRLAIRDWPILGNTSKELAYIALASRFQNIYFKVHQAFMHLNSYDDRSLRRAIESVGGSWSTLSRDLDDNRHLIDQDILRNNQQALSLGLAGTPGYLVGSVLIRGATDFRAFERVVRRAQHG